MRSAYFCLNILFPDAAKTKLVFDVRVGFKESETFYVTHTAFALIDTGANHSCISKALAEKLGIKPERFITITTGTGTVDNVPFYKGIDLILVNFDGEEKVFKNLEVSECYGYPNTNHDFILGMDILTAGDMIISTSGGKTAFSFRVPSGEKHLFFSSKNNGEAVNEEVPVDEWDRIN